MQTEKLKDLIGILQAYHIDLDYWRSCGYENWVHVTSGTPTYAHEDDELVCSNVNGHQGFYDWSEVQQEKAQHFMDAYIADVSQAIEDLKMVVEAQS
tara:strand:- start:1876 stop:2166 length:291 start_codon:yes stop_codon:yes gene_type:complete